MSDETSRTAQQKLVESTQSVPTSTAAQQSDNVAHALAGAGGGLLSMALTYVFLQCLVDKTTARLTWWNMQIPAHYPLYTRSGRIEARAIINAQRCTSHHQA